MICHSREGRLPARRETSSRPNATVDIGRGAGERSPALAALALLGCTKPLPRLYPGDPRPRAEVAILRHETGFMKPSVFFDRIDGTALGRRMGDVTAAWGGSVVDVRTGTVVAGAGSPERSSPAPLQAR